jgi:hypothetical protein
LSTAVDDYNVATALRFGGPMLSGFAAIGGVILAAYFATSGETVHTAPTAGSIFDLTKNAQAVGTAALFGFTPALLVDRIDKVAEKYRQDLKKSERGANAQ